MKNLTFLIALGLFTFGKISTQAQNISTNLEGCYPLDNNATDGSVNSFNGTIFGGSFYAENGRFNIGVDAQALPSNSAAALKTYQTAFPGGANIGLYASCKGPNPVSTTSAPTLDFAGYFDGDVNIVGNAFCTLSAWSSDKRFKNNIKELTSVSEKISRLKSYTYEFKTDGFEHRNFPKGEQIGFVAQELKEVFPQLVIDDKQGYLSVNYVGFIPVLLQLAKEQQQQTNELKAMVNSLAGNIPAENKSGSTTTGITVNLSDKNIIELNQNVPNPFAESTMISYTIPTDFTKAQIIFTTNEGVVIKVIDIKEKGTVSINVFANDLIHGMYSYVLVVDGKTIATKKMIKD